MRKEKRHGGFKKYARRCDYGLSMAEKIPPNAQVFKQTDKTAAGGTEEKH